MASVPTRPLDRLPRGLRDRTWASAKIAGRVGLAFARKTLGSDASAADDEATTAAMEQVADQLGNLKGLAMKLGQIASYMPGAVSPAGQRILSRLQHDTTPLAHDAILEVLRSELGPGAETRFADFSPEPFAAASIGQVHRARVDGTDVAVKVQYPGIEDTLDHDLKVGRVIAGAGMLGTAFDAGELVAELRARMLEECDYRQEAANQIQFGGLMGRFEGATVPQVFPEHSGRRVLTTQFVDGMGFEPFCGAPQAARDRAGAILFEVCFDTLFRHGLFNGDPHPGNYRFDDEGNVTFLDFGCVRRFDRELMETWKVCARAVLDEDRRTWRETYTELGFAPDPRRFDWNHQWEIMQYVYRPFLAPPSEPFRYTDAYVRESYDLMVFRNPNRFRTGMPGPWLLLNRLQWGLNAVLASLGATADWATLYREAIETLPAAVPPTGGA